MGMVLLKFLAAIGIVILAGILAVTIIVVVMAIAIAAHKCGEIVRNKEGKQK